MTIGDCGKIGLPGRPRRAHLRPGPVPRDNLLDRFGRIEPASPDQPSGAYTSPIESGARRFFSMLGTLVRGRVSVGGGAGAATRNALALAIRYALVREQFNRPDSDDGIPLMEYATHRRRLLIPLARSYALALATNDLVANLHELQGDSGGEADEGAVRRLEERALKVTNTDHATHDQMPGGGGAREGENRFGAEGRHRRVHDVRGRQHRPAQLVAGAAHAVQGLRVLRHPRDDRVAHAMSPRRRRVLSVADHRQTRRRGTGRTPYAAVAGNRDLRGPWSTPGHPRRRMRAQACVRESDESGEASLVEILRDPPHMIAAAWHTSTGSCSSPSPSPRNATTTPVNCCAPCATCSSTPRSRPTRWFSSTAGSHRSSKSPPRRRTCAGGAPSA